MVTLMSPTALIHPIEQVLGRFSTGKFEFLNTYLPMIFSWLPLSIIKLKTLLRIEHLVRNSLCCWVSTIDFDASINFLTTYTAPSFSNSSPSSTSQGFSYSSYSSSAPYSLLTTFTFLRRHSADVCHPLHLRHLFP